MIFQIQKIKKFITQIIVAETGNASDAKLGYLSEAKYDNVSGAKVDHASQASYALANKANDAFKIRVNDRYINIWGQSRPRKQAQTKPTSEAKDSNASEIIVNHTSHADDSFASKTNIGHASQVLGVALVKSQANLSKIMSKAYDWLPMSLGFLDNVQIMYFIFYSHYDSSSILMFFIVKWEFGRYALEGEVSSRQYMWTQELV